MGTKRHLLKLKHFYFEDSVAQRDRKDLEDLLYHYNQQAQGSFVVVVVVVVMHALKNSKS